MTLAAAALLGGAGPASAASALSDTRNAAAAQYGVANATSGSLLVGPTSGSGRLVAGDFAATSGSGNDDPSAASDPAQPSRQPLVAGSPKLPFTGYAAIAMLLIGVALLTVGLALRALPRRLARP